jgi:signal transduction histidine kinase
VDRNGRLATHPKDPSTAALIDYSAFSVTQKVLRGESGAEMVFHSLHNEERIAAYAPVRGVGWGVIIQEPKQAAFKVRDHSLNALLVRYAVILLISCISASLVLHTFRGLKKAEAKIQSLNDDLQRRANDLEAANKELEAFSYSVSHDLRAPLRAIDGFSQALLEDYTESLDREGKDYLQRLRAASQRMALLIDDLLNLSRVSRRQMSLETVDLSKLAQGILADFRQLEPDREVELRIATGVTTRADRRLMQIALQNLLQNAWKFTAKRERAKIEFGIAQHNGRSAYFVRDNGAGFDMAYADKLFGAFQRLHGAHEFPGTGIGLATVQRIVHRHGGKIWADGTLDGGASFYFTLGN